MELLVFGHAGARAIIFPTSKGKFYEWEDRGMMGTMGESLEKGWLQVFCVDSIDAESWYNWGAHPGYRAYRQAQYDGYLYNEVLPFTLSKNGNPFLISVGASFGGYHAMNFGLKHADKVDRILAMSGLFDIRGFTEGYSDSNVYFNNPVQFIEGEYDFNRLRQLQHIDIILATGRDDRLMGSAREMSRVLWGKGIGNALREWDGWSHDWPYWQKMVGLYLNGHD
jgi:esterase/lipase superfamily enzyme